MRFVALLAGLLFALPALAQAPVKQSGNVSPGHVPSWIAPGIIGDAGTSTTPSKPGSGGITTFGMTAAGSTPWCILNGITTGPYSELCLGVNPASGATLTVQAFNGATPLGLNFLMNGNVSPFAIGADGTPTLVTTAFAVPITISDGFGHNGSVTMNFPTQAAMLAFQPTNVGTNMVTANIAGRSAPGDGGSATYVWSAASTATVLTPYVLQSTGVATGRWLIQMPTGGLDMRVGGAKCDGTTDDSTAINAMFQNARTSAGIGPGQQLRLTVPFNQACYIGPATQVTIINSMEIFCNGNPYRSTTSGLTLLQNGLILGTNVTLRVSTGAVRGCYISSLGLPTLPTDFPSSYAQLVAWQTANQCAITVAGESAVIENDEIIGFNNAVCSSGHADFRLEKLRIDTIAGIDIQTVGDTSVIRDINFFPYWNVNLSAALFGVTAASLSGGAGGSGGQDGAAILSVDPTAGWTCGTAMATSPTINATISGGAITAVGSMAGVGNCTVGKGPNPIKVVGPATGPGSGLTGATLTLTVYKAGQRTGDAMFLHSNVQTLQVSDISVEGWHNGIHLQDVIQSSFSSINMEVGRQVDGPNSLGDTTAIGLWVDGSSCLDRVQSFHASGLGTGILLDNPNQCTGAAAQWVSFTNTNISLPSNYHNQALIHITTGSFGSFQNLTLSGPGTSLGGSLKIDANVGEADFSTVFVLTNGGTTIPFMLMDPTSANNTFFSQPPHSVRNLTASATALCGDKIYMNSTSPAVVTLPLTCPQGWGVLVKDSGNQGAAHQISLTAVGAGTINGSAAAGTFGLALANGVSANVQWNGSDAYTTP